MAKLGPLRPYLIDKLPEIIFMIEEGTKKGEMRLAPFSRYKSAVASIVPRPPTPAPIATPIRSAFCSVTSMPESSIA